MSDGGRQMSSSTVAGMASAVYEGTLRHRRHHPQPHVFGYRMVGIAKAYKNMLSGMYFSHDKA